MEDDIFGGSDYTFDDSSDSDIGGIWGDNGAFDSGSGDTSYLDQYGSGPFGGGDASTNSLTSDGIDSSLGSTTSGLGGTGFNWGSLLGMGYSALSGYAQMEAKQKMSKEDWKQRLEYQKQLMALQEQYYQAHGKQLADAYQNFKQYAPQGNGNGNVFSGLGMMSPSNAGVPPQTMAGSGGGLLAYGY